MSGTALIVDDDEAIRFFAASTLAREGWHVNEASSGEAALTLLEQKYFDILLLDLRLAGIDGLTVMRQVNSRWPDVKIIILTGHASLDSAIEAVRYGAFDYLQKPCSLDDIITCATKALLEKKKVSQQLPTDQASNKSTENNVPSDFQLGPLVINFSSLTVFVAGKRVKLSPTEFALLQLLSESPGELVPTDKLIQEGLNYNTVDVQARENLRVHVSRLRRKLKGNYIRTIRGSGYVLAAPKPK
jgi:DNA-binding response OmpR family regulator